MSYDRFVRPINTTLFDFRMQQSRRVENEVELFSHRMYRDLLCQSIFGITLDQARNGSIFQSPSRMDSSCPTNQQSRSVHSMRALTFASDHLRRILDGPGIEETNPLHSRLVDVSGKDEFAVVCGNGVYRIGFDDTGSSTADQLTTIDPPVPDDDEAPALSHVAVVNSRHLSLIVGDTAGQLFHVIGDRGTPIRLRNSRPLPVTDLFSPEESLCVLGQQEGDILVTDLRCRPFKVLSFADDALRLAPLPNSPYFASGSDHSLSVYDIRSSSRAVCSRQTPSPVTAVAWHVSQRTKTLFSAVGGTCPVLEANSMGSTLTSRCAAKTYGVVRSLLCSSKEDTVITARDHATGTCLLVWNWNALPTASLDCMEIKTLPNGRLPSCGAIEPNDHAVLIPFVDGECFYYWPLISPLPKPTQRQPLSEIPYSLAGFYDFR